MSYGWQGELTRLVPLDKERHLDNAMRWLNDPEVTDWLLVGDFPLTRIAEEAYFNKVASLEGNPTDISFAIETLSGEHIGFSGLHGINWRHGFLVTGTVLGAKELWGKGYGSDAAKVRLHYIFEVLGLRIATSGYLEGNERSKRMLEKAGYESYGALPGQYWKRGKYRTHYMMCITADRYRALRQ